MIGETVPSIMICGCLQQPQPGYLVLIELLGNASQTLDGCASIQILVGHLIGSLPGSNSESLGHPARLTADVAVPNNTGDLPRRWEGRATEETCSQFAHNSSWWIPRNESFACVWVPKAYCRAVGSLAVGPGRWKRSSRRPHPESAGLCVCSV